jgi:signal transduction histidine kinase
VFSRSSRIRYSASFIQFFLILSFFWVQSPASAQSTNTPFTDFLRNPSNLAEILQPATTSWYSLAPARDVSLRAELLIARKKKDHAAIASLAGQMGFYNLRKFRNTEALDFFLQAYKSAKKTGNQNLILESALEVAFVQKSIGAYQSSNEVLQEVESTLQTLRSQELTGIVYALMADNYGWLNDLKASTAAYQKGAKAFLAAGQKQKVAICYLNLGENQLRLDNFSQARKSLSAALDYANDNQLRAVIYRDIGLIEFKEEQYEDAVSEFQKSDDLVPNHLVKKLLKESYMQLFVMYSYGKKSDLADKFHDRYRSMKKELESSGLKQILAERSQIIRMLQFKHEQRDSTSIAAQQLELSRMIDKRDMDLQVKEKELAIKTSEADSLTVLSAKQELDLARKESQISRFQNTRNMLLLISLSAILFVILFYNRYALKKKSSEELAKSNRDLMQTLEQLRSTQDQLIHAEKMAGLGKLTAGIAHEIQNPLNFVRNFSEVGVELFEEYRQSNNEQTKAELIKELEETFTRIKKHAGRADLIVKSMLQHSRAGGTTPELSEVNTLVQEGVQLAYHSMRATLSSFHCRIEEDYAELPGVRLLHQQFSRVILNLSNNAFYAMHEYQQKGNMQEEHLLKVSTAIEDNFIVVKIGDNGPGIPKENLQRIFEPFYTTKPTGKGTGLGLSISYDMIRQQGGDLQVESEEGKGATFVIKLPLNGVEETQ